MRAQIYTHQSIRERHINQINDFVFAYYDKILPQFQNIENESENASSEHLARLSRTYSERDDLCDLEEQARDHGISHYNMLNLGLYTATLAWHATLFEFFHQQIRLFLFAEMKHYYDVDPKTFCAKFSDVKDVFKFHSFDITTLPSWGQIYELQLLCNVIKHGDGDSHRKLRKIAPERFKVEYGIDLFELYKTTLLEITLELNADSLRIYVNALISFWNDVPERCYSNEQQ